MDDRKKIQGIVDAAPEQLKYKIWDDLTGSHRLRELGREKYRLAYERSQKHRRRKRRDGALTSEEIATWFYCFKCTLVCTKCGESDPGCLVFHHRDPTTKKASVASMVRSKSSKQDILDEISKCDVLCFNCHAKKHRDMRRNG